MKNYSERAKRIINMAKVLSDKLVDINKNKDFTEEQELIRNLRNAFNEWKFKETYFQSVTDPDLIDMAIYEMEASKIKYIYFLKKARENGLTIK